MFAAERTLRYEDRLAKASRATISKLVLIYQGVAQAASRVNTEAELERAGWHARDYSSWVHSTTETSPINRVQYALIVFQSMHIFSVRPRPPLSGYNFHG